MIESSLRVGNWKNKPFETAYDLLMICIIFYLFAGARKFISSSIPLSSVFELKYFIQKIIQCIQKYPKYQLQNRKKIHGMKEKRTIFNERVFFTGRKQQSLVKGIQRHEKQDILYKIVWHAVVIQKKRRKS